ncbi:hypothetical protein H0H92_011864 [Tricholoma furcatifolium]|nr:hypothetical protein H0H92_011864 [Tricholoma furcatifolium]
MASSDADGAKKASGFRGNAFRSDEPRAALDLSMSTSSTTSGTLNLRDTLLAALAGLRGTRTFHLHVLTTAPAKHAALYPFAIPRPRAYIQDTLVLLSEQLTPSSPRKLVTAVEVTLYNVPSTSSAVLYVSKVDTTGQAAAPSPTACLVRALLGFFVDPRTRTSVHGARTVWVHVFARAQAQYLFPNSAEYAGKRPLSDVRLCAWWQRMFADVERDLRGRAGVDENHDLKTRLHFVLPGYSELEAVQALKNAGSVSGAEWTYGHPYSQSDIPLPCPGAEDSSGNLGHIIPSFDDDPKSRFMEEMAYTTNGEIKSPRRKRRRTGSTTEAEEEKEKETPLGELKKVNADEFWERMSFRQECVAGAITGFFTLGITSGSATSSIGPLAPQAGQVPSQLKKRVLTTLMTAVEFSSEERAVRGTEMVEGAIRGLCEGIPTSTRARTPPPSLVGPPTTPPRKSRVPEPSPNPFPEPTTSLDMYYKYIYGEVGVRNGECGEERKKSSNRVVVLTARKKKKAFSSHSLSSTLPPILKRTREEYVSHTLPPAVLTPHSIKQEHDHDPPRLVIDTQLSSPTKKRRVTISGPPADSTPISPVVMGFTITHDNPNAIEKVKSMISVKQKQKALIEQRRGSLAAVSPTLPTNPPPEPKRRSPNTTRRAPPSPPQPAPAPAPTSTNSLPPPPISFARRRAEQLGSLKKKPADILISPREAQSQDQLQPAIQSAPPVASRFPMALPRLPSIMGGGDNVRRVATHVPPTPTRFSIQPRNPQPSSSQSSSQRSPPAASVPIASTLVPPTPGLFHRPADKAAFLAPFEIFYDALNDSKQLKGWLNEQLKRSNAMIQSLTQQQEKLNEVVSALVDKQVAPMRTEMAGLHRRVEELEEALRSATTTAGRRMSVDSGKHHKGSRTPLRNGSAISGSPLPHESYTFPPAPTAAAAAASSASSSSASLTLEPSISSTRRPPRSPSWSQDNHRDRDRERDAANPMPVPMIMGDVEMSDSPALAAAAARRIEPSRSLPLEPPHQHQHAQRLSPRAHFEYPPSVSPKPSRERERERERERDRDRERERERPSLSRQASTHSVGGEGSGSSSSSAHQHSHPHSHSHSHSHSHHQHQLQHQHQHQHLLQSPPTTARRGAGSRRNSVVMAPPPPTTTGVADAEDEES